MFSLFHIIIAVYVIVCLWLMCSLVALYVCGCLAFPCMCIIHGMVQWDLRVIESNELSWFKLYYVRNLWGLVLYLRKGGDYFFRKSETVPWDSCLIGKISKVRGIFRGCSYCEMKRCLSFQVISFLSPSIFYALLFYFDEMFVIFRAWYDLSLNLGV